jgi:hypothetical protein
MQVPMRPLRFQVRRTLLATLPALVAAGCATAPSSVGPVLHAEQQAFWDGIRALCGYAYEGTAIHAPTSDTTFVGHRLVMHVSACSDVEIRIPFHVGDDRSRTWVLRRLPAGLELKHVHRYEDGTESTNTNYGGRTAAAGTAHRQEFPADAISIAAVPVRATQWWFLEHYPGHRFAYGLFRASSGSHYRVEFDLSRTVTPPPPAW